MNLLPRTTNKWIVLLLLLASVDISAAAVQRKASVSTKPRKSSYSSGPRRTASNISRSSGKGLSSTSAFQPSSTKKISTSSTIRRSSSIASTTKNRNKATALCQQEISRIAAIAASILLAFNAGFINGACLSGGIAAMKQSTSSLTSAYTFAALGMASGDTPIITSNPLKLIASYMGGSFIAGILHPRPVEWKYSKWTMAPVFFLNSLLLCIASYFAKDFISSGNAIAIFMLATATIGIQHSIVSSHTPPNFVSTAHLSSLTSEMGMMLGQMVRGNTTDRPRFQRFAILAVAFSMGGYMSYAATKKFAENALLFSAALNALIGIALLLLGS